MGAGRWSNFPKNNSALFYTCSLIEYIGRVAKKERSRLVREMGREAIEQIYEYADVFHCEPICPVNFPLSHSPVAVLGAVK